MYTINGSPRQESVSLAATKTIAAPVSVIPESDLVQEGILMIPTLVETSQNTEEIMVTSTSKPWDTF